MSQISPPIRIVLVAAIGLIAAWMLFLRPEATPAPAPAPATAPGVTGLSNAVDGAKSAGAAQEARDAKVQKATGEETATGAASKPGSTPATGKAGSAAATKTLPAPVEKALDRDKILVLGFFNPKSADDRAVRRALADVNRWRGEVVVRSADVKTISRYGAISRGADVEQSPSVIVVDRNAKAETLVGFVDAPSIDQAVVDAMRASGGIIEDKYLSAINGSCATAGVQTAAIPDATSPADLGPVAQRSNRVWKRFITRFAAIKAPAKWQGLKRAALRDGRAISANNAAWVAFLGASPTPAKAGASVARFAPKGAKLGKSWNARMDKYDVLSCGTQN